jgi:hypothetical protein
MPASKLRILGSSLLLLGWGVSAGADEGLPGEAAGAPTAPLAAEAPPVPEEAAADPAPPLPDDAPGEVGLPVEAPSAEAAAEAAVPAPATPGTSPLEGAGAAEQAALAEVPAEAPAEAPSEASPEPAPAAAEAAAPALGMVGYDSQGRPGRIHVVASGDTLWDISDAYLGTPWVWPSIWQDNRAIQNPHLIYPGDHIWITPWEMRKVTPEEAAALLAGAPAAPAAAEPSVLPPEPTPSAAPEVAVVQAEQARVVVSDREMLGLVTAETVEASASIVSSVAKRVMLAQGDRVWIGLGEGAVQQGDQFTIFRVQEKVYDPETRRLLGYHVNVLGWLEVTQVNPETAFAEIRVAAAEIETGDRVMPRPPPVEEVAVQPSPGDVRGQISFLARERTLMGTLEYVYLNRGTLDGLEVGSPLQVYRQGFKAEEPVRGEKVGVPERVIADLLVVKTEPEVSVALIRHTEEELSLGDRFRAAGR